MKKTLSIEAIHHLHAGELGYAMADIEDVMAKVKAMDEDYDAEDGAEARKPYTVIDGIAVYKISGPLLTNGSWWTRFLGYSAYDDIRADLTQAAADPEVQDILLFMGTPGGSVFGVTDASDAMEKIAKIKPLYVYSAKNVASGGYWLAANAGTLIGSPESEWGSVGVIVTHFSYEKRLEEDGVKVTVIKSADLKAVGGPYKDLTDREISHIQDQVDEYNDLFQAHVRSKRPGVRLASMRGETYIGESALRMGLIDHVMSYDQTINHIKSSRKPTTQIGGYKMKMTAEELKAALSTGATLESLGLTDDEASEIAASADTGTEAFAEGTGVEGAITNTENDGDLPGDINEKLVAAEAMIVDLQARLQEAEDRAAKADAAVTDAASMREIISGVMNDKRVAMRLPKIDFTATSTTQLVADYKATADQFDKAFFTGGLFKKKVEAKPSVVQNSIQASQLSAAA